MTTGALFENPSMKLYDFETVVGAAEGSFPEQFTLSRTASIKNQWTINACCGCAMATIAEYVWGKEFSEGWNYGKFRNHQGTGLYMQVALDMWRKIGTVPLADFGLLAEMPKMRELVEERPELLEIAAKYKIKGYANLNYALREKRDKAIKQALMEGIPILAAIRYQGSGHAVALDGWDDTKDEYTIQNSYGKSYGEKGYGRISKSSLTDVYAVFFEEVNMPFADVDPERWSYAAIKHMYMNGLMQGTSETTFEPEKPMTREEMATVLDRLCEKLDGRFERLYTFMNDEIGGTK